MNQKLQRNTSKQFYGLIALFHPVNFPFPARNVTKEAFRLLTEPTGENHAFAMKTLGNLYMEKSDRKEAGKWYRRAAATGDKAVIESMQKKGVYPVNP